MPPGRFFASLGRRLTSPGRLVDPDSNQEGVGLSSDPVADTQLQIAAALPDRGLLTAVTGTDLVQPQDVPRAMSETRSGIFTGSRRVAVSGSTVHAETHNLNAPVVNIQNIHNYSFASSGDIRWPRAEGVLNAFTSDEAGREPDGGRNERNDDLNSPIEASNVIYERHFIRKGRGFPLWIPGSDFHLPIAYRTKGVSIGDVGITVEGAFHFLFNVLLPSNDPINIGRVPECFQHIQPPINPMTIRKFQIFPGGSHLSSSSVSREPSRDDPSGHKFTSSASGGAILTTPEPVFYERLSPSIRLRACMEQNAESWYRYVNSVLDPDVKNGDLHIVFATDKTPAWGLAIFSSRSERSEVSLTFRSLRPPEQQLSRPVYTWEHSGSVEAKTGPDMERNELGATNGEPFYNQCLFLRTISVLLGPEMWHELKRSSNFEMSSSGSGGPQGSSDSPGSPGVAGSHSASLALSGSLGLPQGSSGDRVNSQSDLMAKKDSVFVFETPAGSRTIHPSKIVNEFLLKERPHPKMAISSDRDWNWILPSTPPSHYDTPAKFIEQVRALHTVGEHNGVAYLDPIVNSGECKKRDLEAMKQVLDGFADGSITVPVYLFGADHDRMAFLNNLVIDLERRYPPDFFRLGEPVSPRTLDGHPNHLLSIDDLTQLRRGALVMESIANRSIKTARIKLDSLPAEDAYRPAIMHELASLLLKRYQYLSLEDDLDEGISYYQEALELASRRQHLHLEVLLHLCSALYQRLQRFKQRQDLDLLLCHIGEQAGLDFNWILDTAEMGFGKSHPSNTHLATTSISGSPLLSLPSTIEAHSRLPTRELLPFTYPDADSKGVMIHTWCGFLARSYSFPDDVKKTQVERIDWFKNSDGLKYEFLVLTLRQVREPESAMQRFELRPSHQLVSAKAFTLAPDEELSEATKRALAKGLEAEKRVSNLAGLMKMEKETDKDDSVQASDFMTRVHDPNGQLVDCKEPATPVASYTFDGTLPLRDFLFAVSSVSASSRRYLLFFHQCHWFCQTIVQVILKNYDPKTSRRGEAFDISGTSTERGGISFAANTDNLWQVDQISNTFTNRLENNNYIINKKFRNGAGDKEMKKQRADRASSYDGPSDGGYISNEIYRSYLRRPPSLEGSLDSSVGDDYLDPAPQIKVNTDNDATLAILAGRPYPIGGQSPPFSSPRRYGRSEPGGSSGPLFLPSNIAGVPPMHMNPRLYGGFIPNAIDFNSTFPHENTLAAALEMNRPIMHSHTPDPSESEESWDSDQYSLTSLTSWNSDQYSSPSPTGSNAALPLPSPEETEDYLRKTLEIPYPYPLNLGSLPDEPFDNKAPAIATLIKLAICGSKHKRLTLRQIYDEIEKRYPSWKDTKDKPWQRSIRYNLSLKAIFVRIERPVSHPGKGFYWALDIRQGEGNKGDRIRQDQGGHGGDQHREDDDDDYSDRGIDEDVVMRGYPAGHSATNQRPSSSSSQSLALMLLPGGHQAMRLPQEGAYGPQGYPNPRATFLDLHQGAPGGGSSAAR